MIDEKKLIAEIEKLKSNLIHGACSSQVAMETRCKEGAYNEVLAIIDPLQEEPIDYDKLNSMLNDALSKETKESWNEMLGKEEPKKCMFTKDNYTDEDRKVLCEDCEERCAYGIVGSISTNARGKENIKEDPVSEDLESEIQHYYYIDWDEHPEYVQTAFHFANWQKQKDEHLIWQISSANYEKGKQEAIEQMMKDAVEAKVQYYYSISGSESKGRVLFCHDELNHLRTGDSVKLIVIKED